MTIVSLHPIAVVVASGHQPRAGCSLGVEERRHQDWDPFQHLRHALGPHLLFPTIWPDHAKFKQFVRIGSLAISRMTMIDHRTKTVVQTREEGNPHVVRLPHPRKPGSSQNGLHDT